MERNEVVNMDGNNGVTSRGRGMLPAAASMGSSGMLGLEMSLRHPHRPLSEQQHHLASFPTQRHEVATDHSHSPQPQQQLDHAAYVACSAAGSAKRKQRPAPSLALTSHDLQEPDSFGGEYDGGGTTTAPTQSLSPSPSSSSPWQRMKWTDNMVRLLIMIVYCVGDDAVAGNTATDHGDQQSASGGNKGKKAPATPSTSAAGLLLQKKGKWKSVSRAMVEKGFYVSPQQCEDKFNDLNKRYKRVNELLGKGTACQIVENQALLDSIENLSSKAKEEARKLLNSKHLFFREMCAYHNGGGGGGGCASGVPASSSTCVPSQPPHSQSQSPPPANHSQHQPQGQHCFHHPSELSIDFPKEALLVRNGGHSSGSMLDGLNREDDDEKHQTDNNVTGDEDEEVEEDEDDDYGDDEEEDVDHQNWRKHMNDKSKASNPTKGTSKLLPTSSLSASPPLSLSPSSSPPVPLDQLRCDLMGSLASVGGEQQQRQWLKRKAAELEEQRVGYQCRALGLERQRFKWVRYSSNKEREMERMKLNQERRRLENDRMLLLLRQKEQELNDQQLHNQNPLH